VLLADDHPVLIAAIGGLLAKDCDTVASVGDGVRLLEEAERLHDAVVRQVALAAGAFAYIGKGALGTDLLPAVRAACDGRQT
jgi:DNA-binding NarL/FixJ family response regulator